MKAYYRTGDSHEIQEVEYTRKTKTNLWVKCGDDNVRMDKILSRSGAYYFSKQEAIDAQRESLKAHISGNEIRLGYAKEELIEFERLYPAPGKDEKKT